MTAASETPRPAVDRRLVERAGRISGAIVGAGAGIAGALLNVALLVAAAEIVMAPFGGGPLLAEEAAALTMPVLWALVALGAALCATGLVVGWVRLRRAGLGAVRAGLASLIGTVVAAASVELIVVGLTVLVMVVDGIGETALGALAAVLGGAFGAWIGPVAWRLGAVWVAGGGMGAERSTTS